MELVYLWVEDYKNIHHQGFNFSPRFRCEYDPDTNKLTIDENEDYIENFFGDNINVTAIVGKNGSGKSSVLEVLQATTIVNPISGESEIKFNFLALYRIDKRLFQEDEFLGISKNLILVSNIEEAEYPTGIVERYYESPEFIYNSLFLDAELPYSRYNKYDLASNNFSATPEFEEIKDYVYIDLDYNSISKKLLKINIEHLQEVLDFYPEKMSVGFSEYALKKWRNFIVYDYHKRPRFSNDIIEKVDDIIDNIYDPEEMFLFCLFLTNIDTMEEVDIESLLDRIRKENILSALPTTIENYNGDTLSLDEYRKIECEKENFYSINHESVMKYFDYIDIELFDSKGRSFSSLSHGEKMLFGTIVSMLYAIQKSENKNYFFCFDEPDISLHPNWQKKYIQKTLDAVSKFDINAHFIFTTHSPFLLSDIPKQNIIFLDTHEDGKCKVADGLKEKKETFGANIHTLLSDSFFMSDGLMGEFAKSKINEIIRFYEIANKKKHKNCLIKIYAKRRDKFYQTQSIIGEDYLKQIIENHLVEIDKILLGKDVAKEKLTERKEQELARLRNA